MNVKIHETSAGFPSVGDYVVADGSLYRVVSVCSAIHASARSGRGNYVHAQLEGADWADCEEGREFPCEVRP